MTEPIETPDPGVVIPDVRDDEVPEENAAGPPTDPIPDGDEPDTGGEG